MTAAALAAPTRTVADAMITDVTLNGPGCTVHELRTLFARDHVHAAVIVADDGRLLAVVDRDDLDPAQPDDGSALALGTRHRRTIAPETDLDQARQRLSGSGRRRLAVVDHDGTFRGLLCLKRSRTGFCSDRDVRARSAGRGLSR